MSLGIGNGDLVLHLINGVNSIGAPSAPSVTIPFVEEKTLISGDSSGAWITRSLGLSYANKQIEIIVEKNNNGVASAGIRQVGSTFDLSFSVRRSPLYRVTQADSNGDIEIYSDDITTDFHIIGTR